MGSTTVPPWLRVVSCNVILVISPTTPSPEQGFWVTEKSEGCYYQRPAFTGPNSLYKCPDVQIKKKKGEKAFSPTGRVDGHINSGGAAKSICVSHPIISDTLPGTSTLNWSVILSTAGSCWLRAGVNSKEMGLSTSIAFLSSPLIIAQGPQAFESSVFLVLDAGPEVGGVVQGHGAFQTQCQI